MNNFTPLNLLGNYEAESPAEPEAASAPTEKNSEDLATVESTEDLTASGESAEQTAEVMAEEVASESSEPEDSVKDAAEPINEEAEKPQPDRSNEIIESQHQIIEELKALNSLFSAKIMHTENEQIIIDRMHSELQKYKGDMYAQLIRPILMDIIDVRDSIMRIAATYLAKPEGEQSIPNKTFSDYAYDLQDILEKNSVEIYRSNPGDDFTPVKQRIVKKIATDDESLHGKVAESLSCGYGYNGRTLSAEKIIVYYYEKPVEKNENSEVIENG